MATTSSSSAFSQEQQAPVALPQLVSGAAYVASLAASSSASAGHGAGEPAACGHSGSGGEAGSEVHMLPAALWPRQLRLVSWVWLYAVLMAAPEHLSDGAVPFPAEG